MLKVLLFGPEAAAGAAAAGGGGPPAGGGLAIPPGVNVLALGLNENLPPLPSSIGLDEPLPAAGGLDGATFIPLPLPFPTIGVFVLISASAISKSRLVRGAALAAPLQDGAARPIDAGSKLSALILFISDTEEVAAETTGGGAGRGIVVATAGALTEGGLADEGRTLAGSKFNAFNRVLGPEANREAPLIMESEDTTPPDRHEDSVFDG
jgi:hypothetical protein